MATTQINPHSQEELDTLLAIYKSAVNDWISAIREEEDFATPDHSMKEWEVWDQSGFREAAARDKAKAARAAYADALRHKLYNF